MNQHKLFIVLHIYHFLFDMIWENHDFSVIVMWFNFVLFDEYLL